MLLRWHYSFFFFFLPVIAVADVQHLPCTFKILIHSGKLVKVASGSCHPDVSGNTFTGITWTSNGHPIHGYSLEERRKHRMKFSLNLVH